MEEGVEVGASLRDLSKNPQVLGIRKRVIFIRMANLRLTAFILLLTGLLFTASCRKETCKIRSKHPDSLIKGSYRVAVSYFYSSSPPPSYTFDTVLGSAAILITETDDGTIRFSDNQLTNRSFEVSYSEEWSRTYKNFYWGEPWGDYIAYDCEHDYIKAGNGYSSTPHASYTIWEGYNIGH